MTIEPQIVAKLKSELPEIRAFVAFIQAQANSLNDLSSLKDVRNEDLRVEVRARERAHDVLVAILKPLIEPTNPQKRSINPAEYSM